MLCRRFELRLVGFCDTMGWLRDVQSAEEEDGGEGDPLVSGCAQIPYHWHGQTEDSHVRQKAGHRTAYPQCLLRYTLPAWDLSVPHEADGEALEDDDEGAGEVPAECYGGHDPDGDDEADVGAEEAEVEEED